QRKDLNVIDVRSAEEEDARRRIRVRFRRLFFVVYAYRCVNVTRPKNGSNHQASPYLFIEVPGAMGVDEDAIACVAAHIESYDRTALLRMAPADVKTPFIDQYRRQKRNPLELVDPLALNRSPYRDELLAGKAWIVRIILENQKIDRLIVRYSVRRKVDVEAYQRILL